MIKVIAGSCHTARELRKTESGHDTNDANALGVHCRVPHADNDQRLRYC